MKVEHIAFNVEDPKAMGEWYEAHLGMKVVFETGSAYFLADETGHGIIELYSNPVDAIPDYRNMNPLRLHLAFQSQDLHADRKRLIDAGASPAGPEYDPEMKYGILFVKDPWGFTVQLVRRDQDILP